MPSMSVASSLRSSGGSINRTGGTSAAAEGPARVRPRVAPERTVHRLGRDDRQALVGRDPAEERHQGTRRGIRVMEVLDHDDDGSRLPEPPERAEHALERPCLAPLRRSGRPGRHTRPLEPGGDRGEQQGDVTRRRAQGPLERVVGQRGEDGFEGADDRPVRLVGTGRPGAAAQHGHRFVEAADPADRFVEEPAHPDAGAPADEHRASLPPGGVVEHGGEASERVLAPDEPHARISAGHAPF